jgi:predicted  nucleic acid-binding Zn-ribbon protein
MAWFRNHYECADCGHEWTDEWSCTCDDDCPDCGARHMSPYDSDDLTEIVEEQDDKFVALRWSEDAERTPNDEEVAILCDAPQSRKGPAKP